MVAKQIKYWLALYRIKGLNPLRGLSGPILKQLLENSGGPEELFKKKDFGKKAGLPEDVCASIAGFNEWDAVSGELKFAQKHGVKILTMDDAAYPAQLKEIYDPPALLYVKGAMYDYKAVPAVAVVGTRHPTHYGLKMSEVIGRDLAGMGVAVISGMARGCDTAAHKGALSVDGMTAAVLGTGIDEVYPKENKRLYEEIAEKGVLISEFPMGAKPQPYNFPQRNRIISGLSKAVCVVEAPSRSGALMTARLALDYNREVVAVPGPVTSPKSAGTNKLIKDGAPLVENAQDIMNALGLLISSRATPGGAPEAKGDERLVLAALGGEAVHIDEVMAKTGLAATKAMSLLLEMELKGLIKQMPGMQFSKRF
ncbi:MAG: DNA-protecting protein DprA [Deltaproteobacteria bacterium]|nr:DNA-protecting protein DprA [Deltaproteobacteria bacterium]